MRINANIPLLYFAILRISETFSEKVLKILAVCIGIVRRRYWLSTLLPQIEAYVDYYAQHFKNGPSGKLDMFPYDRQPRALEAAAKQFRGD